MAKDLQPQTELSGESYRKELVEDIGSFSDLQDMFNGEITDIGEAVGGYVPLSGDNKDKLLDEPFIILGWREHLGDMGAFKAMFVMTRSNDKYVVVDGGTGIYDQLNDFEAREIEPPLYVPNGLRKSEYATLDGTPLTREQKAANVQPNGRGTTFYIDTTRSVNRR